ncbi:hypothetical protein SVAN01_10987 [Stagonosporopsis vannaccii]|nr:hypothetical protein SVAN01_10987 [Stagonosporopsis vannaccii]
MRVTYGDRCGADGAILPGSVAGAWIDFVKSTARYLYKAAQTFLDAWDHVTKIASPFVPIGILPSPPSAANFHMADDARLIAPKLLDVIDPASSFKDSIQKKSCEEGCIVSHGGDLDPDRSGFQEYRVDWDGNSDRFLWGAGNTMPPDLPEYIQRGLLMANFCGRSILAPKSSVEKIIERIDPDAEVVWLAVALPHADASILLIQSPHAGNFILDSTVPKSKSIGEENCISADGFDEDYYSKVDPTYTYWQDTQSIMIACVHFWLQNMSKGGTSLQESFDDQQKSGEAAAKLRADIVRMMRGVRPQARCKFLKAVTSQEKEELYGRER